MHPLASSVVAKAEGAARAQAAFATAAMRLQVQSHLSSADFGHSLPVVSPTARPPPNEYLLVKEWGEWIRSEDGGSQSPRLHPQSDKFCL